MGKKILKERYPGQTLEYNSEPSIKNGKCLGHLAGIGADFTKPTRNGRRYPLKLWRNVINSEDFKEGMNSHTIFGENDHPEDRCDTSLKEVSVVMTKMEIRESEGIVWTEFDILDTEQGRLLKSLLDYGCKIGVSSRGIGDEIVQDGETIIDPDTYIYYGHDMVTTPAVKSARPDVTESVEVEAKARAALAESFNREISNATTVHDLNSIKNLLESAGITDESINDSINTKLNELMAANDIGTNNDMSSKIDELNAKISKLEAKNRTLAEKLDANTIRSNETKKLMHDAIKTSRDLSKQLQESKKTVARLQDAVYDGTEQINDYTKRYESILSKSKSNITKLNTEIASIRNENTELSESLASATSTIMTMKRNLRVMSKKVEKLSHDNEVLEDQADQYRDRIYEFESQNEKLMKTNSKLVSENSELSRKLRNLEESYKSKSVQLTKANSTISTLHEKIESADKSRKLTESKAASNAAKLANEVKSAKDDYKKSVYEYLKLRCAQSGISIDTVTGLLPKKYTIEDVNSIVSELSDRKDRLSKLPIGMPVRTGTVVESLSGSSTPEERQTMAILTGTIK